MYKTSFWHCSIALLSIHCFLFRHYASFSPWITLSQVLRKSNFCSGDDLNIAETRAKSRISRVSGIFVFAAIAIIIFLALQRAFVSHIVWWTKWASISSSAVSSVVVLVLVSRDAHTIRNVVSHWVSFVWPVPVRVIGLEAIIVIRYSHSVNNSTILLERSLSTCQISHIIKAVSVIESSPCGFSPEVGSSETSPKDFLICYPCGQRMLLGG